MNAANERGCYCGLWKTDAGHMESQGLPRGFCGFCDTCGRPGHMRHFPGASPYTGAWCDKHYQMTAWLHPMGFYARFLYGGIAALGVILWWALR